MRLRHYALLLCVITFFAYLSSFWNQFVWDDEQFIYNNQFVQNFAITKIFTTSTTAGSGIDSDYYRPLTTLSFALETNLWGLHPFPFHLTNTFLHIASGIFIFLILLRLHLHKNTAFWISLFFLIHPLQTEAVTYINSRGDSLYTFFGLLSVLSFLEIYSHKKRAVSLYNLSLSFSRFFFAVITVVLYICTILSKEIGIAVIGIYILVAGFKFYSQNKLTIFSFLRQNYISVLAIIGCSTVVVTYFTLRATVLNFSNTFNLYNDGSLYSESLLVRILTFTKVIWIYISLILFPYPLHMERSTKIVTQVVSFWPLLTVLVLCLLFYLMLVEYKKNKKLYISFGSLWFFGMLIPVSGIIPINGILYEHWLYLPIVGFFILIYGIYQLAFSSFSSSSRTTFLFYACCTIAVVYSVLTIRQNYFWSTPIRLYEYLLRYTQSARIYNNLGMAYSNKRQQDKAIAMYQKSLQLNKNYPQTFHNLANLYRDTNQPQLAIENYEQALALQPNFYFSYPSLIYLLIETEDYPKAAQYIEHYKNQWPDNPSIEAMEIILLVRTNKETDAEKKLLEFATTFPNEISYQKYLQELLQEKK